jgi:TATA-box binding protein (TBP) (component of TFIID and TFIIIB)
MEVVNIVMTGKIKRRGPGLAVPGADGYGQCRISHTGTVMLMGCKTIDAAHACFQLALDQVGVRDVNILEPLVVCNMVLLAHVEMPVDLVTLAARYPSLQQFEYNPLYFTGATIRCPDSGTCMLFANGKLCILGVTSMQEAEAARTHVTNMIDACVY